MNMPLTKEQAKQNLHWLVNTCISKGGIFDSAVQVATLINSIEIYGASDAPGLTALRSVPGAADQLQNRIDNSEK